MIKSNAIDLISTFDDKRYPHKYLMSTVDAAPVGLLTRLMTAIENLEIDAKYADKHIGIDDLQEGEPRYLLAVATKTTDDYAAIVKEMDRIEVEIQAARKAESAATVGMNGQQLLKHDFWQQVQYEAPDGQTHIIEPRTDLLADYATQSSPTNSEDDDWDADGMELEKTTDARNDLLDDYYEQVSREETSKDRDDDFELGL